MIRPTLACNSDEPHAAHDWFYEVFRRHWWRCPGVDASRPAMTRFPPLVARRPDARQDNDDTADHPFVPGDDTALCRSCGEHTTWHPDDVVYWCKLPS